MALNDLQLSLLAFPQRFSGDRLSVNVLLLPVGNPRDPLGTGPKFAGTSVHLLANVVAGLRALPTTSATPTASRKLLARPPAVAPALYTELAHQFAVKGHTVTSGKLAAASTARIKKALPQSYLNAIPVDASRTLDAEVGGDYSCELRGQAPPLNHKPVKPDKSVAWGQILSYALRQPSLARGLGLVHAFTFVLPASIVTRGGYLYFTLDPSVPGNPWVTDWTDNPDTVKSYAARIPSLAKGPRPLFAATLLPVIADPGSDLATAQFEAAEFDDGFAQVVHCTQPVTIDAATLQADRLAPATDAGIQIGWDDEQVTQWLNNQLGVLSDRVNGTTTTAEVPLGVQGYRVDVRVKGERAWSSLCTVNGRLPFNDTKYGASASTSINGTELWVAPAPVRPSRGNASQEPDNAGNNENAWLPLYFAQWAGSSVVLPDPAVRLLAAAVAAAHHRPPPHAPPLPNPSPDLIGVPSLRYGTDYEFRVRLADLTGGGPQPGDAPVHPGPAPTALAQFRRHVPPKALRVKAAPAIPGFPANPPPTRTIRTLTVHRPRIGYPEAVFAGVPRSVFSSAHLTNLIADALANRGVISVPDPDVDSFDAVVEARVPAHDTGVQGQDPGELDGQFRLIYTVNVKFPAGAESDSAVTLTLDYRDCDDISAVSPPAAGTTSLLIPTARDIRVRLYPRCAPRANYYGTDSPPAGPSSDFIVRKAAATEGRLFPHTPETQLRAFYFQPGPNVPQLLAQQVGMVLQNLTLSSQPGVRTVFGASGAIRSTIAADGSSITFSNQAELLGHWIVAIVLDLERDWTWDGFAQPASPAAGELPTTAVPALRIDCNGLNVGAVVVPRVVSPQASDDASQAPDRSRTQIVFFDAVDANPAPGAFPAEPDLAYSVVAAFEAATSQRTNLTIRLPITTPPVQVPKIAATGIAESAYEHSADYSRTSPRNRFLWIQFDQPLRDPDNGYFGRVLAYGPDPLLAAALQPGSAQAAPESPEPPLPIDPEPVRAIFSGQSEDFAGLDAMTQLVPALPSGAGPYATIFLLPLPPGISAGDLELFGFWTYEFRVGHQRKWSTAQGRYGRPLRVTGIQHPPPHLLCTLHRTEAQIEATAPYATAVLNGASVYNMQRGDPQTQIWFMLYTQVHQADLASRRNILISHSLGITLDQGGGTAPGDLQRSRNREPRARATFDEKEILSQLALLNLPQHSPLSVLAVELLPGPVTGSSESRTPARQKAAARAGNVTSAATAVESPSSAQGDPLGTDLGTRRILRTSPLTAVPAIC